VLLGNSLANPRGESAYRERLVSTDMSSSPLFERRQIL